MKQPDIGWNISKNKREGKKYGVLATDSGGRGLVIRGKFKPY